MSTRPSGRLISTTSAHDPSPSAPISTSLKTQATYPPSVRERARNTRPPSHPQSRDGPLRHSRAGVLPGPGVWFGEEAREMTIFAEQYDFIVPLLLLEDRERYIPLAPE